MCTLLCRMVNYSILQFSFCQWNVWGIVLAIGSVYYRRNGEYWKSFSIRLKLFSKVFGVYCG